MSSLWQDLRYGLQVLLRSRSFAASALLCVALGVGANSAVFSVVNAVLLRPLPFHDADRLAMVRETNNRGGGTLAVSAENYQAWKERAQSVESVAAFGGWSPNLTGVEEPERLVGLRGTADLFAVLGVSPIAGRALTREDEQQQARVVLVSHSFWMRRMSGDLAAVGRKLTLDGQSYEVAGIMPPDVRFPRSDIDLWAPMAVDVERYRGEHTLQVVLRRRAEATWSEARAECSVIMRQLDPDRASPLQAELTPMRDWYAGDSQRILWILVGAVTLVLLMACSNVANLLLAHGVAREQELSIRTSLGATRSRLIAQLLTESACLGLLGGGLGLLLSIWARDALLTLLPVSVAARMGAVAIDSRVLTFTALLSLVSGLIFGIAPAFHASRQSANLPAAASRVSASRLRRGLLVSETALAMILLAGAGLFIRSFLLLYQVDPGFAVDNVLTARINLPASRYGDRQMAAFYEQLHDRLAAHPGVLASGAVTNLPLGGSGNSGFISFEGRPAPPPGADPPVLIRLIVTPGYFSTLRIQMRQGREFTGQDRAGAPPVVIVNESMARRYWSGESPVGRRIKRGTLPAPFPWMTIVGVVADVRHASITAESGPTVYLPYLQSPEPGMTLMVRSDSDPEKLAPAIRAAVRSTDSNQPVASFRTFRDVYWGSIAPRSLATAWMAVFAALALILAAVGIYGVVAGAVARRTREFGIRVALGADHAALLRMAVRQELMPVTLGIAIGLAGAAALTRFIESQMFGIAARDTPTFAAAAVVLFLVAVASCYFPARRVVQSDPVSALRCE